MVAMGPVSLFFLAMSSKISMTSISSLVIVDINHVSMLNFHGTGRGTDD